MEIILEVLLEFFGELVIQLVANGLGLVGEHALLPYRKAGTRSPAASIFSHVLIGAALGGLSLLVFRTSFVHGEAARIATLIGSPLIAGGLAAALGALLGRRGKATVPLERFGYAFLFAFSLALVRFFGTR